MRHALSDTPRTVNSYHRLAPVEIAAPLVAIAHVGAVVEAVRHVRQPIMAVMCIPNAKRGLTRPT